MVQRKLTLSFALLILLGQPINAQVARVWEEIHTLTTYPFSEPNAVPILTRDARLYPYHSFEGYTNEPESREWKVVHLENDLIEVFVLPEVGGKVWGAIVKKTGHEFIYRNEVMKFRNIALRGPWTSGGIEFNFGVIGHTPATATPVDYVIRENADGSVSCIVGSMDLPSRTHWRVEIRLKPGRADFETNVVWYNPTPLEQPYYNWMTGAAFARDDLEMSIPGNQYFKHSGEILDWPLDEQGRYLPEYANNTFEGHKSYHVVGELNDFFGGYYRDDDYGFGHWARHEDLPGQKLWLWALSRQGGIWEDLLTDTDGQYVEFQAGRQLVQYSPDAHVNPLTKASFDPMSASRWSEAWFPVEGLGGLTDASRDGAMHIEENDGRLDIRLHSFGSVSDTVRVWSGARLVSETPVELVPLEPFSVSVEITPGQGYRVRADALRLDYDSDPSERTLSRPVATDAEATPSVPEVDRMTFQARELLKAREYSEAGALFDGALLREPWNRSALLGKAELALRSAHPEAALELANRALQLDAYDAEANFLAGTIYAALGQQADARDALGWAARSVTYRSAAYARLGGLMTAKGDFAEATRYARLAIDFDRRSIAGWRILAVVGRLASDADLAAEARDELLTADPLHHFAFAEAFLAGRSEAAHDRLLGALGGEFAEQTLLEIAMEYVHLGLTDDALQVLGLRLGVSGPVRTAWVAYLSNDPSLLARGDPAFAFPFRQETLAVLQWADESSTDWSWSYLHALNLWALDRSSEAGDLLASLGSQPDFGPAYVARGVLRNRLDGVDPTTDFRRAVALSPEDRTIHIHLIDHLQGVGDWEGALAALEQARNRFPDDFNLGLLRARALIHVDRAEEATRLLGEIQVLPSEHAREAHLLHEQAHTLVALDRMEDGSWAEGADHLRAAMDWPESLGLGRPYEPEERLARFLLGVAEDWLGDQQASREAFQSVVQASPPPGNAGQAQSPLYRLALVAQRTLNAPPDEPRAIDTEVSGPPPPDLQSGMIRRAMHLWSLQRASR